MKIKQNVVYREIVGEHVLIPVGMDSINKNGLFIMNELGAFIWDLITKSYNEEDILKAIVDEFDVEMKVASEDLSTFLDELRSFDFIE